MRKSRSALNIVLVLYIHRKSNKPINFSYKREEFSLCTYNKSYIEVYQNNRRKKNRL